MEFDFDDGFSLRWVAAVAVCLVLFVAVMFLSACSNQARCATDWGFSRADWHNHPASEGYGDEDGYRHCHKHGNDVHSHVVKPLGLS